MCIRDSSAISYSMTTIIRGIGSIPGHAFWTGLSGVSIGWFLCTKRGISSNNFQEDSTKWVVFDSESGQVINSQRELSKIGKTVRGWLYKPYDRSWNLPRNPIIGISLAILGHSLWNGSSWLVSWMFIETDILVQVIASLAWTCLLYTSPSPRDATLSRMPSSA